jgi:hypothetical protein
LAATIVASGEEPLLALDFMRGNVSAGRDDPLDHFELRRLDKRRLTTHLAHRGKRMQ